MVLNDYFIIACKKSPQLKSSQNMHFLHKCCGLLSINHEDLSNSLKCGIIKLFQISFNRKSVAYILFRN